MRLQHHRVGINAGNLLELVGAACGVYGVYRLVGFGWALVCAAVLLIVAAEFVYDGHVWAVPIPHRPQPRQRLAEVLDNSRVRRRRAAARWNRWRAPRASS